LQTTVVEQRIGGDDERVDPLRARLANAESISGGLLAATISIGRLIAEPAPCASLVADSATRLVGLTSRAKRSMPGNSSSMSPSRLAASSALREVMPVTGSILNRSESAGVRL
jgi:hypothetical protein